MSEQNARICLNETDENCARVNMAQTKMITVQPARVDEVLQIKQVLSSTWIDTYRAFMPIDVIHKITALWHSPETLAAEIETENVYFALAKDENNAILGLLSAASRDNEIVTVGRLYVLPAHQRRGIGAMLLDACIAAFPGAHQLRLEVEAENAKGLAFYRKVGFKEFARKQETIEGITLTVIRMELQLT